MNKGVRRALYWLGVLVGVGLLAAGTVLAVEGYAATAGPDGTVRGYFAALQRSDAPAALAFGAVPAGPHTLLTSSVLREQQRIAPLRHLHIGAVHRSGDGASVAVSYTLHFPGQDVPVQATLGLHRRSGDWRLDATAVPTELHARAAVQRMSIVGAGIPAGRTLLFPGALPIRLDTPYLQLQPADSVGFDAPSLTTVDVQPSPAGRTAMVATARDRLRRCVTGRSDPACPLPDERYVPGSLHGTLQGDLRNVTVELDDSNPAGLLRLSAAATVRGSYQRLDFANVPVAARGSVDVPVEATAYAVPPLTIRWAAS